VSKCQPGKTRGKKKRDAVSFLTEIKEKRRGGGERFFVSKRKVNKKGLGGKGGEERGKRGALCSTDTGGKEDTNCCQVLICRRGKLVRGKAWGKLEGALHLYISMAGEKTLFIAGEGTLKRGRKKRGGGGGKWQSSDKEYLIAACREREKRGEEGEKGGEGGAPF